MQEADEDAEIKGIRERSNFKATPIKHYKNAPMCVSKKELTVPKGPLILLKRAHLSN